MKTYKAFLAILIVIGLGFGGCAVDNIDIPGGSSDNIQKFLGTWSVVDNGLKLNYEVTIDRNPSNSTTVLMRNFAGSGSTAEALVVSNSLAIESQVIGQSWYVSGNGSYKSDTRLEITYSLEIGGEQEQRSAVFTR